MTAEIIPLKRKSAWEKVAGVPYLKLNLESGVYFVRKYKAGKGELFKSTGQTTKAAARTVADQMIAEWLGGKRQAQGRRKTVSPIVDELDEHLEAEFKNGDRRPKTRLHDKDYLPLIKDLFGDHFADELDEQFWQTWVRYDGKRMKRQTLFDVAKYLSKTLTFAYERGYIPRKPRIKNPDKPKKTGRVYTDDEIGQLVAAADLKTLSQIALGYECGLRSYEVRCLEKAWLNFASQTIAFLSLPEEFVKSNARQIQLSPGASKMLWEIVQADKSGSPYVYPSPKFPKARPETAVYQNRRWRKVADAAGLTGKTWFRYLRQSFYDKALLRLNLPVQQVSAYGGTSIRTLQKHYLLPDPQRTAAVAQAIQLPEPKKK